MNIYASTSYSPGHGITRYNIFKLKKFDVYIWQFVCSRQPEPVGYLLEDRVVLRDIRQDIPFDYYLEFSEDDLRGEYFGNPS